MSVEEIEGSPSSHTEMLHRVLTQIDSAMERVYAELARLQTAPASTELDEIENPRTSEQHLLRLSKLD